MSGVQILWSQPNLVNENGIRNHFSARGVELGHLGFFGLPPVCGSTNE